MILFGIVNTHPAVVAAVRKASHASERRRRGSLFGIRTAEAGYEEKTAEARCIQMRTPAGRSVAIGKRLWRERRASEIVEMAFVLPLLLTFLIGVFWLARAYNLYETITRAALEGAHYAVLPSCATCGDAFPDTYSSAGSCLPNPTNVFSGYVLPALTASNFSDPTAIPGGSYCQEAVVLDPSTDASVQQCGVSVSITYPLQLTIPFTSLNATTISLHTEVRMRMENQDVSSTGLLQCP